MRNERCIYLEERKDIVFKDLYLDSAVTGDGSTSSDIRNYISHIDDITRALAVKLENLELENQRLREESEQKDEEIGELARDFLGEKNKCDALTQECTRLLEKLKEMEEKYQKELKKSNLLEVENNRNLDEIKSLRKERNELVSKLDKDKPTWKDKIKWFMGNRKE
jgi:DNA repair exonuclease SbcCD ATPase subunit